MPKNKFLLVSLQETQAKQLAKVINNDTCRKILDFLSDNEDCTETQIATKLNIPLSTVHYNLEQLKKGGLINSDTFHYSEKGREVDHYNLANQFIIIAPKSTWGLKEKLKAVLPSLGIAGGISLAWYWMKKASISTVSLASQNMFAAEESVAKAVPMAADAARDSMAGAAPEMARQTTTSFAEHISTYEPLIFFVGSIVVILIYLIWDYFSSK